MANKKILFREVVKSDAQWNKLSFELLNAPPTTGWKVLGQRLIGISIENLNHIEKTSNDPVKTILNVWQNSGSAYIDTLLDALKEIDNNRAFHLLESWVEEFRQNPSSYKNDTTLTQPSQFVTSSYNPPIQPIGVTNDETSSVTEIPSKALMRQEKIGEGSFAVVYKGLWHGVPVALKEFNLVGATPNLKKDCLREATTLARCQFPRIVRFYGVNMEPEHNKFTIVMEYVPKGSLYSVLGDESVLLPWNQRIQIAKGIAEGVNFLHANNIIHCDLKSLNILLDDNFEPKLTDFGLTKIKAGTNTATLSRQSNPATGSTRWLAPEIFTKRAKPSVATDVYSMGMVFWEIASRKVPYGDQPNDAVVIDWIKSGVTEDIPEDCPASFAEIIRECWKPANERPTAATCETMLDKVLTNLPKPEHIAPQPPTHQEHNVNNNQQPIKVSSPPSPLPEIVVPKHVASCKVTSSSMTVNDLGNDHIHQLVKHLDQEVLGKIPAVWLATRMQLHSEQVNAVRRSQSPTKSLLSYLAVFGNYEQRKLSYIYKILVEHDPPMKSAADIVENAIW